MVQRSGTPDGQVAGEDADNVYLREFVAQESRGAAAVAGGYEAWLRKPTSPTAFERRVACVRRYAFGVPNRAALEAIAVHAPIVELGAGTGYWAYLLRKRGVDVVAYDRAPPDQVDNPYKLEPRTWTQVEQGGVEVLNQDQNRALFLCWPGYRDTFADDALQAFTGRVLIYVGEGRGGNTANDAFFERLHRDWVPIEEVAIPQWSGAHDGLSIFRRRHSR